MPATFYERALAAGDQLQPSGDDVARVCEALGDVRELAARYDEADAAYAAGSSTPASARGCCAREESWPSGRAATTMRSSSTTRPSRTPVPPRAWPCSSDGRSSSIGRAGSTTARAAAEAAAAGASALGDEEALANAYYVRAAAEGDRGGPARDFLERALPIFEQLGLLHRQATVLNNMGVRAYYEGAWDEALELYLRSEEVVRRAGDVLTGGHATNNRGEILLDQGHLADAAALFEQALRTYRAAKFPIGEALVMINLGRLAAEEGRFADAHRYLDEARAQLEALGAESFLIEADARRAQAFILEGRHADVVELATAALERMRGTGELGVRSPLLERLLGLAAVQARTRDEALPHFDEGVRLARSLGAEYELGRTLNAKAVTGFASDEEAAEAKAILERLGVVALPHVPLP